MRFNIFILIIGLGLFYPIAGLWNIQINKGDNYFLLSEENRIKLLPTYAPRGKIFDRNKTILADNRPSFNVVIIPEDLKKHPKSINELADLLSVEASYIWKKIKQKKHLGFLPVTIKKDISSKIMAKVEERLIYLPGVYVSVEYIRKYTQKQAAAHLIGYIGEINRKELNRLGIYGYKLGDLIGKEGVERSYDKYLRGIKGGKHVEVSAGGRYERVLGYKNAIKGNDILLTLDMRLQKIVEEVFAKEVGCVVIMNPNNGKILAMTSKPSFDPNVFVDFRLNKELKKLLNNKKNKPVVNRATMGLYAPGSVFKLIVGLVALEEDLISRHTSYNCIGWTQIGNREFNCWLETGHGSQNIVRAIKNSCNVFFYRIGQKLGVDKISKYSFKFGLGKKTGIELIGENPGFVPTRKWKRNRFKDRWYPGETANFSIGQGYLLVTPLQLLTSVNVIANGGFLCQPRVIDKIITGDSQEFEPLPTYKKDLHFNKDNIDIIKLGMKEVVNHPYGTGKYAKIDELTICGKTGTVQVAGRGKIKKNKKNIPWHLKNHAWFASFAPYEKPELSMIVFVEHGESGGHKAAVVAHDIWQRIVKEKLI